MDSTPQAASAPVRQPFSSWPGNVLRFLEIGLLSLVALVFMLTLHVCSLAVWPKARRQSWLARWRGRILRATMTLLGATFIKLGQVMSSRPDLFPPETIVELKKLQDQIPPFSFERLRVILAMDLGVDPEKRFASLETKPIAAASVAQVHRGVLVDGTVVAVKVLRPDVRRKAQRDGHILRALGWLAELHPKLRLNQPRAHMDAFIDGIISQTDLRQEAANYERFRKNHADEPMVFLPKTYPDLSGEHVLTMDFVEGIKVDALPPGTNRPVAQVIRRMFLRMCFEYGFVHADLHPGNLIVTADQRIALIDVGLVKEMQPYLIEQFVDFSRCLSMGTAQDFVVHVKKYHHYMDNVDWAALEADASALVARFRGRSLAEVEMSAVINDVLSITRRHRVRPLPEMMLVLVGIVTSEGIGKMLDPQADTFKEMTMILMPLLARQAAERAASSAPSAAPAPLN